MVFISKVRKKGYKLLKYSKRVVIFLNFGKAFTVIKSLLRIKSSIKLYGMLIKVKD